MCTSVEIPAPSGTDRTERVEIRPAAVADIEACARLQVGAGFGEGSWEHGHVAAAMERAVGRPDRWLGVAASESAIEGFARLSKADRPATADAPAGFCLGGVTVAPRMQRRGIGLALTRERLALAFDAFGADRVWYFANARNASSIALHAKLGFVEVRRPFECPQVTFEGGVGVLFVLQRDAWVSRAQGSRG
jgi:RimJ/RimL family protein N-acetyltransferase